MKISIGSDHAGFALKKELIAFLESLKVEVLDQGCYSEERADYPDFAHKVAENVLSGKSTFGILICGSGNGISMAANKHNGIRCALCWEPEIASLARQHNDANILSLPARFISVENAKECVNKFLSAQFEGGRHADRIKKINC